MCDPVSIAVISTSLAVGSQVLQYSGQQKAYDANVTAANMNFANQNQTINTEKAQLDAKLGERHFDEAITQAKSEGQVVNSASASGLAPSSLVHALNASDFGLARTSSVENINDANARQQLMNEQQGARIDWQSQINKVAQPNPLSLILGIGGSVAGGASTYAQLGGKF